MAKIIEQIIAVKLSKIVKNEDENSDVLDQDTMTTLLASIPELAESIISDSSIIVESIELE
jgi:hypothetical protein